MNETQACKQQPSSALSSAGSSEEVLADFDRHLERQRGCTEGTRQHYRREARALLVRVFPHQPINWNNLTAVAMTTGKVHLESDGSPWRPLVHVEDISRAFLAALEAPRELVHDQAFNVGRAEDNVQVRDIAEMVQDAVPGAALSFAAGAGPDLRDYRVDFSKLDDTFPDLKLRWHVRDGVDDMADAYQKYGLSYEDFTSSRFVRLRRIRELLAAGLLDDLLHRNTQEPFAPPVPG